MQDINLLDYAFILSGDFEDKQAFNELLKKAFDGVNVDCRIVSGSGSDKTVLALSKASSPTEALKSRKEPESQGDDSLKEKIKALIE